MDYSYPIDKTLYYTALPMPHVEEANEIIVIVIDTVAPSGGEFGSD